MSHPPSLFDPARVRASHERAQKQQAGLHPLLADINAQIRERLEEINRPFLSILEIGGGDFSLAQGFLAQNPQRSVTRAFLAAAPPAPSSINSLVLDGECLPFAAASFDLVILNMTLHHVNDVPGMLAQLNHTLKPDGLLLAAFFGGDTLFELRSVLAETEMALAGGASPRLSPLIDIRDAGMLLMRAGFALPAVDRTRYTLTYPDSFALMHDVRALAASLPLNARSRRFMGKAFFEQAKNLYQKRFAHETGDIVASYDIFFMAGWHPAAGQQVALKPGAAKARLAKALNGEEITADDPARP
jgi:SAM-dependent methyltransferase